MELPPREIATTRTPAHHYTASTGVFLRRVLRASQPGRLDLPSGGEKK